MQKDVLWCEMYDNHSTIQEGSGSVLLGGFYIICEVAYYLRVDCDTSIMHILNPRATTKKIKQGYIVSKSIVEIKQNTRVPKF